MDIDAEKDLWVAEAMLRAGQKQRQKTIFES